MTNRKPILITIVTIILFFVAFAVHGYLTGSGKKPMEELNVADANFQTNALYFIALEKGYFKEEDLVVNRKIFTLGKYALNDVILGNSDIAAVPDVSFLIQQKSGQDIKIISTLQKSQKSTGIVGWRKFGVNKVTDLAGQKVGAVKGTNSEFVLLSLLAINNVPKEKVNIYYGGLYEIDDLFRLGKLDAVSIPNPNSYQIIEDMGEERVSQFYSNGNIDATVLAAQSHVIEEKEEAMVRFLRALAKAEYFTSQKENREEAIAIVTKVMNTYPHETVSNLWDNYDLGLELDNVLLEILASHSESLSALEGLPRIEQGPKDMVFTDYMQQVKPEDVTIIK